MKVLITGSSGLIGSELHQHLVKAGCDVITLVRNRKKVSDKAIFWDPENGILNPESIRDIDAVINCAGEGVAEGRWTERRKKNILDSRVKGTKVLVEAICLLPQPPKVLINASAIGFYGDRGEEVCSEATSGGPGFLAHVCCEWEKAAALAIDKGIRTVFLRFGVVLSSKGGALRKMLPAFRFGLGGNLGDGQQFVSWVSIDDVISIIQFALTKVELKGAVNVVSPNAVSNAVFTKILGEVLHRPTFFSVPSFVLRLIFGKEMADEVLLASTHVKPKKLEIADYIFKYPDLKKALQHIIGGS